MKRKIIRVPAPSEGHTIPILERNNAEVSISTNDDYIIESKYHNNGNYKRVSLIGEFSIDYSEGNITESKKIVDKIKYGKKTLNYQIYVYDTEGPIPHFHVIEKSEKKDRTDCCICIFEPKYFDHGSHTSILKKDELKILNNFLKTKILPLEITIWNYIAAIWIEFNPDGYKRYPNLYCTNKQPDYTNIKGFKSGK